MKHMTRLDQQALIMIVLAALTALTLCHATEAAASSCSQLRYELEDAHSKLRYAANESDLDQARDYARRARNTLDDAANAARDCGCDAGYTELDNSSTYARRARDTSDGSDFAYQLNRAVRAYNDGVDALRDCFRRGRR
jgi:citrate lyase beta subunit